MPLDWRLRGLAWLTSRGETPTDRLTPERARKDFDRATSPTAGFLFAGRAPVAAVHDLVVDPHHTAIAVRMYRPEGNAPLPIVMYFHGGGWVVGGIRSHDAWCRALCAASGAIVLSVEYRLAPEHRYPTAAEDCYAATVWAAANASTLGGDDTRIAVAGDSSGGNLAAVVALMARDRNGPAIVHQVLIYPVIDASMNTPSYEAFARGYMLTRDRMRWYWDQYVPDLAERASPYASPLRAERLDGLPPAQIFTAEYDVLRDEGEAYGAALRKAGNVGEIHRVAHTLHGYASMLRLLPSARDTLARIADRLRDAFGTY